MIITTDEVMRMSIHFSGEETTHLAQITHKLGRLAPDHLYPFACTGSGMIWREHLWTAL
jgi:hypothetical protein